MAAGAARAAAARPLIHRQAARGPKVGFRSVAVTINGSRGFDPKVDTPSRSAGQSFLNRGVFIKNVEFEVFNRVSVVSPAVVPNLEIFSIQMGAPRSLGCQYYASLSDMR